MFGPLLQKLTAAAVAPLTLALALGASASAPGQTAPAAKAQPPAAKGKAAAKIDVNKATAEELAEALPGVGPVTAKKIVDGRPYGSVDDLAKAGVPARVLEEIKPLVTVGTPAAAPKTKAMPRERPKASAPAAGETKPTTPAGPVNLNTATAAQLEELPGIGPVAAAAIIAGRPYKSVDELEKVRGIGATRLAALRDLVTVAAAAPAPTPAPATTPAPTPAPAAGTTKTATAPATKPAMPRTAPGAGTAPATATTKPAPNRNPLGGLSPGQVVNINKAPKEELELLPEIGPVKAQAIIDARPFKTKEDVMKVTGIKEGIFARIKDLIKVD